MIGQTIGHYKIISYLGAGGMGEVYLAEDTRLDREVALKFLPALTWNDPDAKVRLIREAKAASKLDHPNIVTIHGIEDLDGKLFIVMARINGTAIDKFVESAGRSIETVIPLALQIADGLQNAHDAGIIHRDLKPGNIFVDERGRVRILDFGLARISGAAKLTKSGSTAGTPAYTPPEVIQGGDPSVRSDIYSLGVVLYQLLGGRLPFEAEHEAALLYSIVHEDPLPLSEVAPAVPPAIQAIVMRCLAKDPTRRYASSEELAADLRRGTVSPAKPGDHPDVAAAQPANRTGTRARPRALWTTAAIVLLVSAYFVVTYVLKHADGNADHAAGQVNVIKSIAVLPLDNYSGDPSQNYFAEGMTDELTANLATISQLRVTSRGSAMQFASGNRPSTPEIAKILDVDAVVEGSVTRVGDKVRITAQLIDARADMHLWAHTFERSSSDVLALQAELASAIANEINVQLTPFEQSRLAAAPSVDPAAHDAYLKGRYFFNRPSDDNLKKAIAAFKEAVAISPEFAPAYSGLSDAYLWAGYNEGFLTASQARPLAMDAAMTAVALDSNSAEAHTSLAVFKLFYEYDWIGCEREFRRAIELNPSYAFAHDQFGLALAFQGRIDEAIAEGELAADLDPLSPQILIDNCMAFVMRGDLDSVRSLAQSAADLDPAYFFPVMMQGWVECEAGNFKAAIPLLREAREMDAPAFVTAWLAYAYGASGDTVSARAELVELQRRSLHGQMSPFDLAMVSLGLGDHDRAIEYLEQAYKSDSQWLGWLNGDRVFDPLRAYPRFIALLQKLKVAN